MSSSIESLVTREYQHGFVTDVETETVPRGLSEDTVRLISAKKNEPPFMLDWRLKAYRRWQSMTEPTGATSRIRRSITRTSSTTRRPRA